MTFAQRLRVIDVGFGIAKRLLVGVKNREKERITDTRSIDCSLNVVSVITWSAIVSRWGWNWAIFLLLLLYFVLVAS